jgi:hypothetical protein
MTEETPGSPQNEPVVEPAAKGILLPGVAAIALYMLFMAMMNAFGALRGMFPSRAADYSILAVCTLLALGVFGLLRMKRWGWALVMGGAVFLALGDAFYFKITHAAFFAVRSLLEMVFFLYLVRTEVRERMR